MTIRWHQLHPAASPGATVSASERLPEPPETGNDSAATPDPPARMRSQTAGAGWHHRGPGFLPAVADTPRPLWTYGHDTTTWVPTVRALEEGATAREAWAVFLDTTTTTNEATRALRLAALIHGRRLGRDRTRKGPKSQ